MSSFKQFLENLNAKFKTTFTGDETADQADAKLKDFTPGANVDTEAVGGLIDERVKGFVAADKVQEIVDAAVAKALTDKESDIQAKIDDAVAKVQVGETDLTGYVKAEDLKTANGKIESLETAVKKLGGSEGGGLGADSGFPNSDLLNDAKAKDHGTFTPTA